MSFDRVAPHYRWLETLVFGRQLQAARVAFVREITSPRRVLVVGEGDGRFLAEFVREHPGAAIDCVEASGRMIKLAQRRVGKADVSFIQGDIREVDLASGSYDLLVTHFFLDCFGEESLPGVVEKLSRSATLNARWLVADFCFPAKGWRHLRAQFLITFMYLFFRVVSGIEARRLVDYQPRLRIEGFERRRELVSANGMIRSELWERG